MREITVKKNPLVAAEISTASRGFWSALLFPCVSGATISLVAGLGISFLSTVGVLGPSRALAYWVIGLLLSSFVLMFLSAHCMDRRDAADKRERLDRCRARGYSDPR